MEFEGFDWDAGNRKKSASHGVSVTEIEDVFRGTLTIFADRLHSIEEQRFKAIGRTVHRRFTLVVFTLRRRGGRTLVRPISARYMHRKEVMHYEKEAAGPEN